MVGELCAAGLLFRMDKVQAYKVGIKERQQKACRVYANKDICKGDLHWPTANGERS